MIVGRGRKLVGNEFFVRRDGKSGVRDDEAGNDRILGRVAVFLRSVNNAGDNGN